MKEIPLTKGQVALIDDSDAPILLTRKWQAQKRSDGDGFYAVARGGVRMHRFLLGVVDDRIVDHKNGNGLDNRRENLRIGTQSLNSVNRKRTPGKNLRGVQQRGSRFRAQIKHHGHARHLGCFNTEAEAHQRYLQESRLLNGDWQPLPAPPTTIA